MPIRMLPPKALLAAVAVGGGLGASLVGAPPASADPASNYAAITAPAVCATLTDYPTFAGINGVVAFIVQDAGFSYYDAGRVVGMSVYGWCPQHAALIERYAGTHAPKGQRV